jgi:hypothetical protein
MHEPVSVPDEARYVLRAEMPADTSIIRQVLTAAFEREVEALLVDELRETEAGDSRQSGTPLISREVAPESRLCRGWRVPGHAFKNVLIWAVGS